MKRLTPPLRIAEYRRRRGLTQEALAAEVGIRRETLVRIERGRQFLTPGMESRIAFALGIAPEERNDAFGYPIPHWLRGSAEEVGGSARELVVVARDGEAVAGATRGTRA